MQEKMISHFFDFEHNGSIDDMYVQIIDHCDPNDKEGRESFWIKTINVVVPNKHGVKHGVQFSRNFFIVIDIV